MKKRTITAIIIGIGVLALTGCSNKEEETSADSTIQEAPVAEHKTITPLESGISTSDLKSGDYITAASIEDGGIYKDDDGKVFITATLCDYDRYDMADIEGMSVGDSIVICGDNIEITNLEDSDGTVIVNEGIENGGYNLVTDENTVYYASTWDDLKLYYAAGQTTLPLSDDFAMEDSMNPEIGTITYSIDDILNGSVENWYTPNNTQIHILNGEIVNLTRIYNP